ncbi:hypothetical protein [Pontivivens nitratireducens]|uniref:hypothetical protein n=1 Tax=Pontivivens nitratireducens TaxID=2758038 RepID=UPI00197B4275|nr:hypothetical protein [Pontibrevibacter nitratireducens]
MGVIHLCDTPAFSSKRHDPFGSIRSLENEIADPCPSLDQCPKEWLERMADERVKRAAFELVAARGTASILLPEDAERLSLEGLRLEDLGRISTEVETLKGWLSASEARETVAQSAGRTLGRGPQDAREEQLMQRVRRHIKWDIRAA